jgi:hypothetical protein
MNVIGIPRDSKRDRFVKLGLPGVPARSGTSEDRSSVF